MKKTAELWKTLGRPIYVVRRLKNNLIALISVSSFTAVLGLVLIIIDVVTNRISMLVPSLATFLGGVSCAIIAGVFDDGELDKIG